MLCGPCYTCARTRYGLKSFILWTVIGVILNVIMWSTKNATTNNATASAASRSTDDVIADLTQDLANCQADSVSNESLNTQSLLAQLERDIDNME